MAVQPKLPRLPGHVLRIIQMVAAGGGRCYLVGGALRDLILGKTPLDWDFAATLPPQKLLAIFPGSKLIGGHCGTVQASFVDSAFRPLPAQTFEVTPTRAEGRYSDRRHPDTVAFVPDILGDLARRDFTVNAMAYDGQVLFDPFGGQQDLRVRLLRCVGNPTQRFEEDPLRVLRLYRFAAQLGFTAEWGTFRAAGAAMPLLAGLPAERVRAEVEQILLSAGPQVLGGVVAAGGLHAYGLYFAPPLAALALVPAQPLCRWWALCALCGAPVAQVASTFGFSRRFAARLAHLDRLYRQGPAYEAAVLKRKLRELPFDYAPVAATFAAVSPAYTAEPAVFASVCARHEPYRVADLAISGAELAAEGITGRDCGRVLGELLDAVINNPALNQAPVLLGLARGLKQML